MNHVTLQATAPLSLTEPSFATDAHHLSITDQGSSIHWHQGLDQTSASMNFADNKLYITNSLMAPCVLHVASAQALTITLAEHVDAHVVLMGEGRATISLHLLPRAHCRLYLASANSQQLRLTAQLAERAHLDLCALQTGSGECVRNLTVELNGPYCQFDYHGLDQLHGSADIRSELVINHNALHSISSQRFRGVYGGESRGHFSGMVVVNEHAFQAEANQQYKALILGDKAKAHVKPELVIFNPNIVASHGASIGEIDQEALFYLLSRGVPLRDAQTLLIESFCDVVLQSVDNPVIKTQLAHVSARATKELITGSAL